MRIARVGIALALLFLVPAIAAGVEDPEKFEAYKYRRAARRAYALEARRAYNASKGPAVFWTAMVRPVSVAGVSAIQAGFVYQPPVYTGVGRGSVSVVWIEGGY
jgi:hypothetical protein